MRSTVLREESISTMYMSGAVAFLSNGVHLRVPVLFSPVGSVPNRIVHNEFRYSI
jgi:hypothetical protein